MKEVFTMWKNTRMVVLVALTAAVYGAVLAVFKGGIVLIPGITEIRPGNLFPPMFSLLFGPAAAWGTAFGNLIGDLFGTLGPGSFFGFWGNFLYGYVPYKIWGHLGLLSPKDEPDLRSAKKWIEYLIVAFVASSVCAVFISWGVDLLGLVPYAVLSTIITFNNFVAAIFGGVLLLIVFPVVKNMGLLWQDVLEPEDIGKPYNARIGTVLMVVGGVLGWIIGAYVLGASMVLIGVGVFVLLQIIAFFIL